MLQKFLLTAVVMNLSLWRVARLQDKMFVLRRLTLDIRSPQRILLPFLALFWNKNKIQDKK